MWRSAFFNGKWPLWVFLDATSLCRRDSSGLHKCEYSEQFFFLPVPSLREDSLISFRADQVTPAPGRGRVEGAIVRPQALQNYESDHMMTIL